MQRDGTSLALADIRAERVRQMNVEGWTEAHDDKHSRGDMAMAAACYAIKSAHWGSSPLASTYEYPIEATIVGQGPGPIRRHFTVGTIDVIAMLWPWGGDWWKPKDRRRDLVRAAALIVAEIERLDRIEAAKAA
jgi:hypothetical protein